MYVYIYTHTHPHTHTHTHTCRRTHTHTHTHSAPAHEGMRVAAGARPPRAADAMHPIFDPVVRDVHADDVAHTLYATPLLHACWRRQCFVATADDWL